MKEIILTHGKVTLVDDWNYWLNQFKWCAHNEHGHWYAYRWIKALNGKRKMQYMHRAIMGNPEGMEIDHRNGDGLLNIEENLRVATHAQNQHNQVLSKANTSGKKGVHWENFRSGNGKWRAQIRFNGKLIHLGSFDTLEAAAQAYNEASIKYHGEFGFLNSLPQEHQAQIAA